jgi:hypothetical protein
MTTKDPFSCSFCGRSQKEVQKLIAGPCVYICDECVRMAADIIKYNADEEPAPEPHIETTRELSRFIEVRDKRARLSVWRWSRKDRRHYALVARRGMR